MLILLRGAMRLLLAVLKVNARVKGPYETKFAEAINPHPIRALTLCNVPPTGRT